jgi:hypothetical protein
MKKLAVLGALGLMVSSLYGQGLNAPTSQSKDDWEEINFEFNSSILSDGYPSLLRLADLLKQHTDYKVKVTGHTDYVGSAAYNDKLAQHRAETVKSFLVKYGAPAGQITTSGDGKRNPEVDNKSKEGRFMNRRVVLTVTDANGKLIKEGPIGEVINGIEGLQEFMKKQEECCAQILKRLDKLDDILAALKGLQGENDNLKSQLADLRNQHNMLRDQVAGLPKPLNEQQTTNIAHNEAMGAVDEAQKRNKKFTNIGLEFGPVFGPVRESDSGILGGGQGGISATAHAQFFSPFGGDGTQAVQAQGEYMYYPGRQEGQFDIGLVKRIDNFQIGSFGSFKYLNFKEYQNGGGLGQAAVLVDYIFSRGRIGFYGTKGFKNYAVLNSVTLAPGAFLQTYARVADQFGVDTLFGVWGNASIAASVGYIVRHTANDRPGANFKLTQPISEHFAFTASAGYNETYVAPKDSGQIGVGLEFGNFIRPKEFATIKTPVPMEVPRIRYEMGTRRVGASPPIADAGPNQLGIPAGTVTLNGSGSYDPLGEALTYSWVQISGPAVTLATPTAATTTFTAAAGQTYSFRLTVKNTDNLTGTATTTVSAANPLAPRVLQFTANPTTIQPGGNSTLSWVVENATTVTIAPQPGSVDAHSGTSVVTPSATTTYTLTATGPGGSVNSTVIVTVATPGPSNPQILRFAASPLNITLGQSSTLSWTTQGAATASISGGVGSVALNGSVTVTPTQTTTYTLTATGSDGKAVTAPITVTVATGSVPQIVQFVATPQNISAGQTSKLCWQVTGATSISISPGVGSNLNANDCANVSPTATTTYTLTATNSAGQIQGNAIVNVGTVQILSFTANPAFVTALGNSVTLSWQTTGATSVVLTGANVQPMTLPVNGSTTVVPPSDTTYTLTAYGPGGQTVSSTISVFVR